MGREEVARRREVVVRRAAIIGGCLRCTKVIAGGCLRCKKMSVESCSGRDYTAEQSLVVCPNGAVGIRMSLRLGRRQRRKREMMLSH